MSNWGPLLNRGGGASQQAASVDHSAQPAAETPPPARSVMYEYVRRMEDLHPELDHPTFEWVEQNVGDAPMVDQDDSSPAEGELTYAAIKGLLDGYQSIQDERFTKVETAYTSLQQRNTLSEITDRETRLDK